jgi:microcystin-dependent protein
MASTSGSSSGVIGSLLWYFGPTAPSTYLYCDGSLVLRAEYPALFNIIGEIYGAGDGSTTFQLPDLRNEFIRGAVDISRPVGMKESDDLKSHRHTVSLTSENTTGANKTANTGAFWRNSITKNTSYVGGSETRPRNIALLPCIKAI